MRRSRDKSSEMNATPPDTDKIWREVKSLSLSQIAEELLALEQQIAPIQARISVLKKSTRGRVAAAASAKSRAAAVPALKVQARRDEIAGGRGHVPILVDEFKRSARTIARKLSKKSSPSN